MIGSSIISWVVGLLMLAAVIVGGVYAFTNEAEKAGYEAGQKACAVQAANDNAAAVDRLKSQVAAQNEIARNAHERAAAAHKALEAERAAHEQTRADQCNAGCRVHIPGVSK